MARPPMSEMAVAMRVPMAEIMVGEMMPEPVVTPCVPEITPVEMAKTTAVKRVSERMRARSSGNRADLCEGILTIIAVS